MRHRKAGVKLNRTASHRKAMFRNMITSLFEHERIVTTQTKAKALRPLADKMITLAKRGDLHSRRQALAIITKKSITHKLFTDIKDRYINVSGGYTTLAKLGPRRGDGAPLAVISLIDLKEKAKKKKKTRKKAAAAPPTASKKEAAKAEEAPETKEDVSEPKVSEES
ncbi:MAG: 50S ribosomal protein L17 [Deltaproteobacteria bacterium]|nr:50S ribosomal protein L17 [Deltaproteobacteria bacterium]MBW2051749.1 50S ribosomal protein L17 [Deltaproteobacteria bacterium]MBW2140288.1 50S ribosomal protein L17 [Deltaproteobacteria bacterium]MBW2322131.1 50S ribosomal protein L17 [Deltaproteobacteria bacterium]